jgi:hypothetical protein
VERVGVEGASVGQRVPFEDAAGVTWSERIPTPVEEHDLARRVGVCELGAAPVEPGGEGVGRRLGADGHLADLAALAEDGDQSPPCAGPISTSSRRNPQHSATRARP